MSSPPPGGIANDDAHRPRRIGLRPAMRDTAAARQRPRPDAEITSVGKFHYDLPNFPVVSLNHLVGASDQRGWHVEAERLGGR